MKQEDYQSKREREGERKSSQILVEPCDGLIHSVGLVFRFDEEMAFARINDQLCRHAEGFQRGPEFVRLRCRAFRVALADDDEGRGLYILDEVNGRTFLVNGRIIVNGCAEERDHPLIDQVLTIVTLPIRNAGTGNSGAETICLRNRPHRHKPAITPTHDAETVGINWIFLDRGIDSREIVAQIAAAKVLNVRAGKIFALAITSARIGKQHIIAAY